MNKQKFKTKISIVDTLRTLPIGECIEIFNREVKISIVKSVACRLKKKGYQFKTTEADLPDSIIVTRIK